MLPIYQVFRTVHLLRHDESLWAAAEAVSLPYPKQGIHHRSPPMPRASLRSVLLICAFFEFPLALLQLGDVGVDDDRATIMRPTLGNKRGSGT